MERDYENDAVEVQRGLPGEKVAQKPVHEESESESDAQKTAGMRKSIRRLVIIPLLSGLLSWKDCGLWERSSSLRGSRFVTPSVFF